MNAIEIKGLCKNYGRFRLSDIDLTLPCGCIMGLIGENGAGKSTTIRLLLDIIKKDFGEIRVFGKEMTADATDIKNDIGVVLDEPCFPELFKASNINSIMKNIYKNWNEETFFSLLKRFDIDEKKRFKALSKGMKMKMSIAVALSHDAKLLILDEPTSGLDPVIRDEIVEIFYEFTRNPMNSILISSHIVSDLEKLCDYIAFLHKGRLILCDEKDRLLEKYCVIHCTADELSQFSDDAVMHKKESPYGVEAIVERAAANGFETNPVGIEELFVAVIKEAK